MGVLFHPMMAKAREHCSTFSCTPKAPLPSMCITQENNSANLQVNYWEEKDPTATICPLPYKLPPEKYSDKDEPWVWDRQRLDPDIHGYQYRPWRILLGRVLLKKLGKSLGIHFRINCWNLFDIVCEAFQDGLCVLGRIILLQNINDTFNNSLSSKNPSKGLFYLSNIFLSHLFHFHYHRLQWSSLCPCLDDGRVSYKKSSDLWHPYIGTYW